MRISDFIARVVTQRRGLVWCGVAALATVCIAILVTRIRLDSDVLNIFPSKFSPIARLKIYDRDFEQTPEPPFAPLCDPPEIAKPEELPPIFPDTLRHQPWCE